MSELADQLKSEFEDAEYAHGYVDEHTNMVLAAQIKLLREQQGLTQSQLAERARMKQERISALENVDYNSWTVKTLRKLAKAFDVGLEVRFVPFSSLIMQIANESRKTLSVKSRADDLAGFCNQRIIQSGNEWKAIDRADANIVNICSQASTSTKLEVRKTEQVSISISNYPVALLTG